uniref:Uncharacterized protein n=1 Tax=Scleropages formosus TaxID=113540 RepID=A0A8C9SHC4_SCLFO
NSNTPDQDEFFSFLSHVQRGRMEQQRCILDPNKKIPRDSDMDQLLNLVTKSHSSRLDDQRVLMSASMPGLHVCPRKEEQRCSAPRVLLNPGSQVPSMKVKSRSTSPSQNLRGPASFNQNPKRPTSNSIGTDKEAIQNSTYQSIQVC